MSSKQELSFSDGESCGSATSHRSSTRCPICASGLRGLSISSTLFPSQLQNPLLFSLASRMDSSKKLSPSLSQLLLPSTYTRCDL